MERKMKITERMEQSKKMVDGVSSYNKNCLTVTILVNQNKMVENKVFCANDH